MKCTISVHLYVERSRFTTNHKEPAACAARVKDEAAAESENNFKDRTSADLEAEFNLWNIVEDPEFEDPTFQRKYKYAERWAMSACGVIAAGSLYLINTENSKSSWQFNVTLIVIMLSVVVCIGCGFYIKDLMYEEMVRASKLFLAKKKETASKTSIHEQDIIKTLILWFSFDSSWQSPSFRIEMAVEALIDSTKIIESRKTTTPYRIRLCTCTTASIK